MKWHHMFSLDCHQKNKFFFSKMEGRTLKLPVFQELNRGIVIQILEKRYELDRVWEWVKNKWKYALKNKDIDFIEHKDIENIFNSYIIMRSDREILNILWFEYMEEENKEGILLRPYLFIRLP